MWKKKKHTLNKSFLFLNSFLPNFDFLFLGMGNAVANTIHKVSNIISKKSVPDLDVEILDKINDDMCTWCKLQDSDVSAFEIGISIYKKKEIILTVYTSLNSEKIVAFLPPSIRQYRIILTIKPLEYGRLC
jgi:hypothetical protein